MLGCRAARLLLEEEAPHDEESGALIAAGFVAVPHSKDWDRLILDRRPLNHGEARQRWMKLPLGGMLCWLVLPAHCTVRGSGYDLATYFKQPREHESGIRRNVVGQIFSGRGYEAYGADPSKRYILALECIGMGDVNAVEIAELTHLGILE